ncbi:MAG: acyl-ACP--UDP-N-acetylglucosamine O-acyltransferase [bacterium]
MIEKTVVIDPSAKIAEDVKIGHYSIVGPNVEIGPGCEIGSHVVLEGPLTIGKRNRIFHFAYIGGVPQDLSYKGEISRVEIGDDNTIREYVTIHRGTSKQNCLTRVGNHNLLMAYVHVAHDCIIGDHCILANAVNLGGHVEINDYASIGGMVGIHQFVRIGRYSFIGGLTAVTQNVLPFSMVVGERGSLRGTNITGLRRNGFNNERRSKIDKAIRYFLIPDIAPSTALEKMIDEFPDDEDILEIVDFARSSGRGIIT